MSSCFLVDRDCLWFRNVLLNSSGFSIFGHAQFYVVDEKETEPLMVLQLDPSSPRDPLGSVGVSDPRARGSAVKSIPCLELAFRAAKF